MDGGRRDEGGSCASAKETCDERKSNLKLLNKHEKRETFQTDRKKNDVNAAFEGAEENHLVVVALVESPPRATCRSREKHALLYSLQLLAQSVNPSLHVFVPAAALSDALAAQLLGEREKRRV